MEFRTTINGVLQDSKLSEEIKYHAKENTPRFLIDEIVTIKRLKMECKVLDYLEQEHDLRGRLTSPMKYLVKGTNGNMIVNEYELLTDKMIADIFNTKNK